MRYFFSLAEAYQRHTSYIEGSIALQSSHAECFRPDTSLLRTGHRISPPVTKADRTPYKMSPFSTLLYEPRSESAICMRRSLALLRRKKARQT
jgi:hypothetical protein